MPKDRLKFRKTSVLKTTRSTMHRQARTSTCMQNRTLLHCFCDQEVRPSKAILHPNSHKQKLLSEKLRTVCVRSNQNDAIVVTSLCCAIGSTDPSSSPSSVAIKHGCIDVCHACDRFSNYCEVGIVINQQLEWGIK